MRILLHIGLTKASLQLKKLTRRGNPIIDDRSLQPEWPDPYSQVHGTSSSIPRNGNLVVNLPPIWTLHVDGAHNHEFRPSAPSLEMICCEGDQDRPPTYEEVTGTLNELPQYYYYYCIE